MFIFVEDYSPEVLRNSDIAESEDTPKEQPVNLCGAVGLRDVKEMLKEWTTSVEGNNISIENFARRQNPPN